MRDGALIQIDREESLDHLPILDVLLSLLNPHGDFMNHVLLCRCIFEHCFEGEFANVELVEGLLIITEPLDTLCLPGIARLFLGNGVHQSIQVHHFTLNPISHMDEWVDHLATKGI